jgi:hypothetical protein
MKPKTENCHIQKPHTRCGLWGCRDSFLPLTGVLYNITVQTVTKKGVRDCIISVIVGARILRVVLLFFMVLAINTRIHPLEC